MIRLQDNVPEPYVDQSRDFQLMARLYDCVINGVKFAIDGIESIINTSSMSAVLMPLLQTKLGFFSNEEMNSEEIRYILKAFPEMVRNKGSILAIKQAVRVYMKLKHIKTDAIITITSKNDKVEPCAVKIGLHTSFTDITALQEMLTYLLPTGYTLYLYFYENIGNTDSSGNVTDPMYLHSGAKVIYITDSLNSAMRDSSYSDNTENRIVGAVDTTEVVDEDSAESMSTETYGDSEE